MTGEVAGPDVPKLNLVRVGLGIGHQFRNRLVRQVGVDDEDQRRSFGDLTDQREVRDRVIGHRDVVQVLHVSQRIDEQGVAVGLRPPHRGRAGHARRAGLVLDHDGLPDTILHFGRQHARGDVGQPAGRERHHEGNGAAGIRLRSRRWRRQHNGEKRNEEQPEPGPAGQCVCRHVSLTRSSTACDGSASTSRATQGIMPPCGCRGRGPLRGRSAPQ